MISRYCWIFGQPGGEKDGEKDVLPSTGDESSPVMPFMLMLASILCFMFVLMSHGRIGKKYEDGQNKQ